MKIRKSRLKQIIKEELEKAWITEAKSWGQIYRSGADPTSPTAEWSVAPIYATHHYKV